MEYLTLSNFLVANAVLDLAIFIAPHKIAVRDLIKRKEIPDWQEIVPGFFRLGGNFFLLHGAVRCAAGLWPTWELMALVVFSYALEIINALAFIMKTYMGKKDFIPVLVICGGMGGTCFYYGCMPSSELPIPSVLSYFLYANAALDFLIFLAPSTLAVPDWIKLQAKTTTNGMELQGPRALYAPIWAFDAFCLLGGFTFLLHGAIRAAAGHWRTPPLMTLVMFSYVLEIVTALYFLGMKYMALADAIPVILICGCMGAACCAYGPDQF